MKKYMKKAAAALAVAGVALSLSACSSGNKTVVSYKGGKITQEQYYDDMKKSQAGQSALANMIINRALEEQYGSKVSQKKLISNTTTTRSNTALNSALFFNKTE